MYQHLRELIEENERIRPDLLREEADKLKWDPCLDCTLENAINNCSYENIMYVVDNCDPFNICSAYNKTNNQQQNKKDLLKTQRSKSDNLTNSYHLNNKKDINRKYDFKRLSEPQRSNKNVIQNCQLFNI
eukprot:Mrub_11247.p2 GENE.Mrub_11247~~Mrub_11247.p2  ORF type:complete len:130 (-),score=21.23 Mrub_11247:233-622(-)